MFHIAPVFAGGFLKENASTLPPTCNQAFLKESVKEDSSEPRQPPIIPFLKNRKEKIVHTSPSLNSSLSSRICKGNYFKSALALNQASLNFFFTFPEFPVKKNVTGPVWPRRPSLLSSTGSRCNHRALNKVWGVGMTQTGHYTVGFSLGPVRRNYL